MEERRVIRPRGNSRGQDRQARSAYGRLADAALVLALVGLVGVSLLPTLDDGEFASVAPIVLPQTEAVETAEATPAEPAAPSPTTVAAAEAAVPDAARPLGSLGETRGSVAAGDDGEDGEEADNGLKVIDVEAAPREPSGPIVIRDPSDQRLPERVAHLPDQDLIEKSGEGPLPIMKSGRRPLDVYAGRWSGRRGNRIAIVVGGIGISQTSSSRAIEVLPSSVTLAFSADGNSLKRWMETARREGHEVLLQVPMQGFDGGGGDGGNGRRLTLNASPAENNERLRQSLGRLTNYVGVMNYTGAAFSADAGALTPVMAEVRDRGLMYLDDGSAAQSVADGVARENDVPFAVGDIAIDADRDSEAIAAQLARIEEMARGTGRAIGVASAFPESIEAIARWIGTVESRGFEVVPVSALARDPGAS